MSISGSESTSKDASDFSEGYYCTNFNPDNIEPRKRVMNLAEAANKGGWKERGIFARKLLPYKLIGNGKVAVKEEEEIRKSLVTEKLLEEEKTIQQLCQKFKISQKFNLNEYPDCEDIIFIADLHLNSYDYVEKENYFKSYLEKMSKLLKECDPIDKEKTLFICSGDLTDFGTRAEFFLFKLFIHETGFRNICIVPGNHDLSVFYGNVVRSDQQSRDFNEILLGGDINTNSYPKLVKLKNNIFLVLVDSNIPKEANDKYNEYHTANGKIGKHQLKKIEELIGQIKNDIGPNTEFRVTLCMHHHPISHPGVKVSFETKMSRLMDSSDLIKFCRTHTCVKEIVFGHVHDSYQKDMKIQKGSQRAVKFTSVASLGHNEKDLYYHVNLQTGESNQFIDDDEEEVE